VTLAWIDAGAGAAGDMLLAALWDAGADEREVRAAVRAAVPADVAFRHEVRDGFRVARAEVTADAADADAHRTWGDVRDLLDRAPLAPRVRERALAAFSLLVVAECNLHGATTADEVHLHEVGAHDAIADVVGTAAAVESLGLTRVTTTTVAVGGPGPDGVAVVRTRHGEVPAPVPAVLAMAAARGVPITAGWGTGESCTPTGMALLATLTDTWGGLPPLRPSAVGAGAGSRPTPGRFGALRVVVGAMVPDVGDTATEVCLVTSTNVDDLDPRVWPRVLARLLAVGADDAWLAPVVMKKGRPGHVLSVLSGPEVADAVRGVVLTETSAIGLRVHAVAKHALPRDETEVSVQGHRIRVKRAWLEGRVVNAQPEWEDVATVAAETGVPAKEVLALASAAARAALPSGSAATAGRRQIP
jgi:hypothetical protein